ncbi:MAG: AEC family transporter [Treponema sp.]|jgi:predicted permease|nr:AEC family transporter [Treponema sp.]
MPSLNNIINTQLLLLSLIIIGVIIAKTGIVDKHGASMLGELVLNLLLPCNILSSFISAEGRIMSLALVFVISACLTLGSYFLGKFLLYRFMEPEQTKVLCYSTLMSNAAFLGNPVVESIYGLSGLVYASVFLMPLRICMWTLGLALFTGKGGGIRKVVLHPCLIATYIGLVFMFGRIGVPVFIDRLIFTVGDCTTAFSMIVVGHVLAQVNLRNIITKTVFYYSFIRLLFIPLVLMITLLLCRVDPLIAGVSVALAGMPAPSTVSILANKYGGDSELASKIILVSVLLSMLTVPAWTIAVSRFF